METGVIGYWNTDRGFGFVKRPGLPDVFMHISAVNKVFEPEVGDKVAFEIEHDDLGRLRAINARLIAAEEDGTT